MPSTPLNPRPVWGFDQYLKEAYFSYLTPVGKGLRSMSAVCDPTALRSLRPRTTGTTRAAFCSATPFLLPFRRPGEIARSTTNSLTGFFVNGWNNVVDNNTGKLTVSFGWNPNKIWRDPELHGGALSKTTSTPLGVS